MCQLSGQVGIGLMHVQFDHESKINSISNQIQPWEPDMIAARRRSPQGSVESKGRAVSAPSSGPRKSTPVLPKPTTTTAPSFERVNERREYEAAVRAVSRKQLEGLRERDRRGEYVPAMHFARGHVRAGEMGKAWNGSKGLSGSATAWSWSSGLTRSTSVCVRTPGSTKSRGA